MSMHIASQHTPYIVHQSPGFSDDIMPQVFVKLSINDLAVCLRTCKVWKQILEKDTFWNFYGYETIDETNLCTIASDMWDKALEKRCPSTPKFICASNPLAQGLMIFGSSYILGKTHLNNTQDLPAEFDTIKFLSLKGKADLFDPNVNTANKSNLINCKIHFGKGIELLKQRNIEFELDGKNCRDD